MRYVWRLAGFLLPCLLLLVFMWMDIQPDGVLKGELRPGDRTAFLYAPLPDTRIKAVEYQGENVYAMTGDPSYFTVRLPKTRYDYVTVGVEYLPLNQSTFEIGPEAAPGAQSFDLKPLYQEALEKITWPVRKVEDGFVYERPGTGPDHSRNKVATYAYEYALPYRDPAYVPSQELRTYEVDLRGSHRLKTYVKNESLNIDFTFTDMNREIGRDDIVITVRDENGRMVKELRQDDDGNENMDQGVTRYDISLQVNDLPEGVYEISIDTNSDLFIRTIETSLSRFVFLNRLYVGDNVGWRNTPARTDYYGNGQAYTLLTLHNEGLQTVYFDDASVPLEKTHTNTQFVLEKPKSSLRIRIPQGDVSVVGDGVFALTADTFFAPDPRVVGALTDIERLGVDAVYASYERQGGDGWRYGAQTFNASEWWDLGYTSVRFALAAPSIVVKEGAIYIKRITVEFEKPRIHTLGGFLRAARERIPFGI